MGLDELWKKIHTTHDLINNTINTFLSFFFKKKKKTVLKDAQLFYSHLLHHV